MINRLKQMEMHFKQLNPHNKEIVLKGIDALDDWIEDVLLEENYHHDSKFIRQYRKHYDLKDIKRSDKRNRSVIIHSRVDGNIRETHPQNVTRKAEQKARYEQRERETNISKIMAGSK
ncbi:hypothetical protein E2019_22955 [Salmonella enterica subsp. enterica serovar Amager]|nr:hypothetical protein [Salmonella enterica subsp. enterica serovar Amager]ECF3422714.1 hypothetical protein [Salmonella enterica subsp. enterica serovar Amager]